MQPNQENTSCPSQAGQPPALRCGEFVRPLCSGEREDYHDALAEIERLRDGLRFIYANAGTDHETECGVIVCGSLWVKEQIRALLPLNDENMTPAPVGSGHGVQRPTHAAQHEGCEGCQHRHLGTPSDWCYMFRTQPRELPCAQHDQFSDLRRAMARTPLPILAAITASLNARGDS